MSESQKSLPDSGDVFISYRRCNAELVEPVEEELNQRGISYFIDTKYIDSGMDYSETIARAIKKCKILLVVWTQEADQSKHMLREIEMAFDLHKKVIPYKVGSFDVKEHNALYYQLSTINRQEADPQQTPETIKELVNRIEVQLKGNVIQPTPEPLEKTQPPQPPKNDDLVSKILNKERQKEQQREQERLQREQQEKQTKEKERLETVKILLKESENAIDNDDYRKAVSNLEEILALEPDNKTAQGLLPHCKSKMNTQEAEKLSVSGTMAGERMAILFKDIEFAFRWCPEGSFMMGNYLTHKVNITKGFWIMETQVTQKQWIAIMGDNPSHFTGDDMLPVDSVSWYDCFKFCEQCSLQGLPVQLPTEEQWEYACRAGTTGSFAGELDEMGWYDWNSGSETHPVGQKKPNPWGLYDMHGNVCEWCMDECKDDKRMIRGGCYFSTRGRCSSGVYWLYFPNKRVEDTGFRCVVIPKDNSEN